MNIEFDFTKCPKDPEVEVFHPDGTLLVRTDNEKLFLYICATIKEKQESGIVAALTGCHEQAPAQQQADPDIQCDSTVLNHLFPVTDQQRDRYTEEDEILQSAGTIRKSRTADQIEEKASKTDEQPDNQQKTESLSVFPFKINSEAFYFSGIKKLFDLFSSITVHYEFSILEPLSNSLYRLHRAFSRECTGYPCVMEGIPSVLL